MTTYRLFPSTNGPGAVTSTSGGWLLGAQFSVTLQMAWLNGYFVWTPSNGDTVPVKWALWNVNGSTSTQAVVSGSVVTSGAPAQGQWNYTALDSPIQLAPGAQYVAAVGWAVSAGIPVTSGQFDSGDPFASGITNGILTAWSAGTGSNPYPNPGGLGGQMVFSNVLGDDPSTAMPNNGSGSDNLWVDLQISGTAPGGYAGSYRMYPNMSDLGNYNLDTANGFTLGKQFSLSQACTIGSAWFYSPATVSQLPTEVAVYSTTGPTLVASNVSPSWSGAAGSGWVSTPMSGILPAGTYKYVVFQGSNVIWNGAVSGYYSTGFGGAGLTAGPITVPGNATALSPGQETYHQAAVITYPDANAGPYAYGLDLEVTPVPPPAAAPVLYSMRMMP